MRCVRRKKVGPGNHYVCHIIGVKTGEHDFVLWRSWRANACVRNSWRIGKMHQIGEFLRDECPASNNARFERARNQCSFCENQNRETISRPWVFLPGRVYRNSANFGEQRWLLNWPTFQLQRNASGSNIVCCFQNISHMSSAVWNGCRHPISADFKIRCGVFNAIGKSAENYFKHFYGYSVASSAF